MTPRTYAGQLLSEHFRTSGARSFWTSAGSHKQYRLGICHLSWRICRGIYIFPVVCDDQSFMGHVMMGSGNDPGRWGRCSEAKPFDFWSAASGLADRVKKGTAELATTVRTTDWRAEIQAFGEDLAEETEELGASAISAAQQAVDNLEHLPTTVRPPSRPSA